VPGSLFESENHKTWEFARPDVEIFQPGLPVNMHLITASSSSVDSITSISIQVAGHTASGVLG